MLEIMINLKNTIYEEEEMENIMIEICLNRGKNKKKLF